MKPDLLCRRLTTSSGIFVRYFTSLIKLGSYSEIPWHEFREPIPAYGCHVVQGTYRRSHFRFKDRVVNKVCSIRSFGTCEWLLFACVEETSTWNFLVVALVRLLEQSPLLGLFNCWARHFRQMTLVHPFIGASKCAHRLVSEDHDINLVLWWLLKRPQVKLGDLAVTGLKKGFFVTLEACFPAERKLGGFI